MALPRIAIPWIAIPWIAIPRVAVIPGSQKGICFGVSTAALIAPWEREIGKVFFNTFHFFHPGLKLDFTFVR